jgi:hypothetical protein
LTDLADPDDAGLDLGPESVVGNLQNLELLGERRLAKNVLEMKQFML